MTSEIEISNDAIGILAAVAGVNIPKEDEEALLVALRNHLRSIVALDTLDIGESEPAVTFDPRWK